MARSLSSLKRMRQNVKRRARNKTRKTVLKTEVRKLTDIIATKDAAAAEKQYRHTASMLDKTAAKGTIHRNTASRKKSRLAKRLNAMKATAKS